MCFPCVLALPVVNKGYVMDGNGEIEKLKKRTGGSELPFLWEDNHGPEGMSWMEGSKERKKKNPSWNRRGQGEMETDSVLIITTDLNFLPFILSLSHLHCIR